MEKERTQGQAESPSGFEINCSSVIQKNRLKVVSLRVTAAKDLFLLTDALAKHGAFPTLEQFISGKVSSLLSEYLGRAEEVVSKAADLSKSGKQSR